MICFGDDSLYYGVVTGEPSKENPFNIYNGGHYRNTYLYKWEVRTFHSAFELHSLPPDNFIGIYSYSGQESAYVAAYLTLLGYEAKSVLFGAHTILASQFDRTVYKYGLGGTIVRSYEKPTWFAQFGFNEADIRNYPYETGD